MNLWKQTRAILLLPGMVIVVIPMIILYLTGINWLPSPWNIVLPAIGCVFVISGLILMVSTIQLFIMVGKGTLAPFDPTQKLVVLGVYRHVRNPMIVGVFCILFGETLCFASPLLLGWFFVAVLLNVIYIPLVEEPGLVKRFGNDYLLYKENVPRWIPRLKPWDGLPDGEELK
jgi:protein-S-isoprenylcysteine O-methyltransferase Ste14